MQGTQWAIRQISLKVVVATAISIHEIGSALPVLRSKEGRLLNQQLRSIGKDPSAEVHVALNGPGPGVLGTSAQSTEYQDQFGRWHHYQTKQNQADANRVAKRRAESTGKRHRLVDGDGRLMDLLSP